jgi:fatty acid desaturase
MGLVGATFLAWMIVRAAWTLLTWVVVLLWLVLRGAWFLAVTLPMRAIRKHRANTEYQRLIDHLVDEPRDAGARRIDKPTA